MKVASDGACFAASINYVSLLFKMDPINTNIVEILDSYLVKYPFLTCQQILLSILITYQLQNKNDVVEALKYIDKLLDIKFIPFAGRMRVSLDFKFNTKLYRRKFKKKTKFCIISIYVYYDC